MKILEKKNILINYLEYQGKSKIKEIIKIREKKNILINYSENQENHNILVNSYTN